MPEIEKYLNRVTSAHRDKPRYMATMRALLQPLAEVGAAIAAIGGRFELDTAEGQQLDIIGEWVGLSRNLRLPLENVYFSFDIPELGFDLGVWQGPFDPDDYLTALPDDTYRSLLRIKIRCNNWDGTFEQAEAIWQEMFAGLPGASGYLIDNQDMTMTLGASGIIPAALQAVIEQGLIPLKPFGVRVTYLIHSAPGPVFSFDLDTAQFAGFDVGYWAGNL